MKKLIRSIVAICLIVLSQYSYADVVLLGNMNIGDNSTSVIVPTVLVAQNNNNYIPGTLPIHFFALWLGYKLKNKTRYVRYHEMQFPQQD